MSKKIETLLEDLRTKRIQFTDVIAHIDNLYQHTATAFSNGEASNTAHQNQGSAKVFAFARINSLSKADTLLLFAEHYQAVLNSPTGTDHQNIRQFSQHGWEGIVFEGDVLVAK
ncbi:HopJ type III effector protein [Sphingobacterium paludis]|uniref:HopJ type III effector protein n=1 Tax=Sphingobacterium paludis TaxID=1476465 RepID=A0A4V3E0V3_9SPHI|nr:HopJ type III effector protein [Sphingobacterium paludis]TDS07523.1 HopJ type III effector protein [Sphingobacterium paludis]